MIGDVEDVIESAIGGQNITRTIEGRERYPVNVRYEQGFRDTFPTCSGCSSRARWRPDSAGAARRDHVDARARDGAR